MTKFHKVLLATALINLAWTSFGLPSDRVCKLCFKRILESITYDACYLGEMRYIVVDNRAYCKIKITCANSLGILIGPTYVYTPKNDVLKYDRKFGIVRCSSHRYAMCPTVFTSKIAHYAKTEFNCPNLQRWDHYLNMQGVLNNN